MTDDVDGPDPLPEAQGRVLLLRELDTTAQDLRWPRHVRGLCRDVVENIAAHPLENRETQVRLPGWDARGRRRRPQARPHGGRGEVA